MSMRNTQPQCQRIKVLVSGLGWSNGFIYDYIKENYSSPFRVILGKSHIFSHMLCDYASLCWSVCRSVGLFILDMKIIPFFNS